MPKKKKKSRRKATLNYIDNHDQSQDLTKAWENRPELHDLMLQADYEFIQNTNTFTINKLGGEWEENLKANAKYWKRHKSLTSLAPLGLGRNKAVVGIGAGPSFNINKDILREYLNMDGIQDWEHRNFITICANHQFKPLLEMNIIPDFVIQVDGSDVTYDQLCKNIPPHGQNTTLITGVHCHPRVTEAWTMQGRHILFYAPSSKDLMDMFQKHVKKNPHRHKIELGGCTINGAFMVGAQILGSTVFIAVGHDCGFEKKDTIDEQRNSYYADGDYSTNAKGTGTGRDEANTHRVWGGFKLARKKIIEPNIPLARYNVELDEWGTSQTLWVYKTWVEITMMGLTRAQTSMHYYNCTEGGIVGVMAKERDEKSMHDAKNWFMLDGKAQNVHSGAYMYHTALLEDVMPYFNKMRELYLNGEAQRTTEMSRMQQIWEPSSGRLVQVVPR